MALSRQIINLIRTYFSNDLQNTHRVAKVSVMQVEMRLSLQMSNTLAVVGRRTADRAVNVITFVQQQFSQERAVLACNPSD